MAVLPAGRGVDQFNFYLSFYGMILGLSVAQVASGLAAALSTRRTIRIGRLTPLLGLFVLLDITSFWLAAWVHREHVIITWTYLYAALLLTTIYYLAAALVFPVDRAAWPDLDAHFRTHKRFVVGGLLIANAVVVAVDLVLMPLQAGEWLTLVMHLTYFGPLVGLLASRSDRVDTWLLGWLIAFYLLNALNNSTI